MSSQGPSHSCRGRGFHHTSLVWDTPAARLLTNGFTSPALDSKQTLLGSLQTGWWCGLFLAPHHISHKSLAYLFVALSYEPEIALIFSLLPEPSKVISYQQVVEWWVGSGRGIGIRKPCHSRACKSWYFWKKVPPNSFWNTQIFKYSNAYLY